MYFEKIPRFLTYHSELNKHCIEFPNFFQFSYVASLAIVKQGVN